MRKLGHRETQSLAQGQAAGKSHRSALLTGQICALQPSEVDSQEQRGALASCSHCNKLPPTWRLKTIETSPLPALEATSLKPRCRQGRAPWEGSRGRACLAPCRLWLPWLWLHAPASARPHRCPLPPWACLLCISCEDTCDYHTRKTVTAMFSYQMQCVQNVNCLIFCSYFGV